ncbi:LysR family transcriptional regulator [Micromonospora sp. AKA38]|nr:LysR family transcriptional regulator [Micromonospora sp. AKA38]
MRWSELETLNAIAETGSFTGAAHRLGVSRPLVSKRVQQLEEQLGLPLVQRTTRSTRLTPQGEILTSAFTQMAATWRDAYRAATRLTQSSPRSQRYVVATYNLLIPPLIRHLATCLPTAEWTTEPFVEGESEAKLHTGEVDLVLGYRATPVGPPGYEKLDCGAILQQVLAEPVWLAVAAHHPLAGGKNPVDWAQVRDEPWLVRTQGALRVLFDSAVEAAGFTPKIVLETDLNEEIKTAVAHGTGIALGSPPGRHMEAIRMRPLASPPTRTIYVICGSRLAKQTDPAHVLEAVKSWYRTFIDGSAQYRDYADRNPRYFLPLMPAQRS